MGKYSREYNDFFNAIKDIEADVEKLTDTSTEVVSPYEIIKHGQVDISEDINPIKLKNFLVDHYKTDWLDWLPEVTNKTLFGEQKSEVVFNKIQALRACLGTDTPWLEWHIFENVGKAFNHQVPDFTTMQPLSVGECMTTMDTMKKLRPHEKFSNEILAYIAAAAANDGFVYLPDELQTVQPLLSNLIYDPDLALKTKIAWDKLKDRDVLSAKFSDDDPVHRQITKLALAQEYHKEFV